MAATRERETSSVSVHSDAADADEPVPVPSSPPAARDLPTWFVVGLVGVITWCGSAGVAGTAFLLAGWYEPIVVALTATAIAVAVAVLAARRLSPRPGGDHRAAAAAVLIAFAFLLVAGTLHSEHLLVDRDPAVYIVTGRTIARTHELRPSTREGPFVDAEFGRQTVYDPGFFPMLPVLLAQAWSLGGDRLLFLVGPLLGALGLLTAYALSARVLGSRGALLVPALLVVVPLQLWFARDAYSELVVQVVALGGLWLYLEARRRRAVLLAVVAAALIASSAVARVDALAISFGVLVFAALEWVRCDRDESPAKARRTVAAFIAALVVGNLVAYLLAVNSSSAYFGRLDGKFATLLAAFSVAIVGLVVIAVLHRKRPGIGRALAQRRWLFVSGVVVAAVICLWAYVLRPKPRSALPVTHPGVPLLGDLRAAVNAWHYSRSLHWFSAYLGVLALVLAFAGFVVLADRARRGARAAAAVVLLAVPVAVVYLARPSITPDQPWAMRRFLPVVIPGVAIAIAAALQYSWRGARSLSGAYTRGFALAGVGVLAAFVWVPAARAATPLVGARSQHGAESALSGICRETGPDAAVLVFGGAFLDLELPDTVRAFCGVPTAKSSTTDIPALARKWKDAGRRLVVLTAAPDAVRRRAPGATVVGHHVVADDHEPEKVFDRAPRRYKAAPTEIWVLTVPA